MEIIDSRFGGDKETRHDMTGSFIAHGMSQEDCADESLFQMFAVPGLGRMGSPLLTVCSLAGSDTTSTVLRTGFLCIIANPRVYARLQAEVCAVDDVPLSSIISLARAVKLPYLQACITEALRFNPPAVGLNPRRVGPEGDTHNGVYLPPGTEVGQCQWNLHRANKLVYGDDAEVYRPERWLDEPAETLSRMRESIKLVFGYGRFRCLGENIARLELNKMFFEMFRRYDWSLVDPANPIKKDINYGLFFQSGMWMKVEERRT